MKLHLSTLLCLFWAITTHAQDFSKIDAQARSTPFPKKQDTRALAQALSKDCSTEKEKVRAYFVWIADNIKYDIKSFENRTDIDPEERKARQLPQRVLQTKKAVCEGYSNLFVALCTETGIKALKVEGITKNYKGIVSRAGHAWCIVRADGVWGLIDATWGAGTVDLDEGKYYEKFKEIYFFSPPEVFIADHFPHDPLFQMLPNPLTMEEFKQAKMGSTQKPAGTPREGFAQIADSLNTFVELDSVASLFSKGSRALNLDPASNYGLYNKGFYHFEKGKSAMLDYVDTNNERQKNRTKATAQWCDQQTKRLKNWETQMTECVEILRKSSRNDNYSASIRSLRHAAESNANSIQKELSHLKQLRSMIK